MKAVCKMIKLLPFSVKRQGEKMERIDKILASQNIGSRKEVHSLIKKGAVTINGRICKSKDEKADPDNDEITVFGNKLQFERYVYIMMNKPQGVLSASNDKKAKTVIDLLPAELYRKGLFPAGRLDKDTEGLLIITDDGDFAHRLLSPKSGVYKLYESIVDGEITQETVKAFENGITFADGTQCLPGFLEIAKDNPCKGYVRICEGKFHQVKKMFISQGLNVTYLKRLGVGSLCLDDNLKAGMSRKLTRCEIEKCFC